MRGLDDLKEAVRAIHGLGCRYVLAKGGHLDGQPVDVLFDGEKLVELPGTRIEGRPVHGIGCVFSAALTARIGLGDEVPDAASFAKEFAAAAIRSAGKLGKGNLLVR